MSDYEGLFTSEHLLEVKNLTTRFYTEEGTVHAVNDVSYTMDEGEMLGVVGESGCGKSVHALSMMRLIPMPPGKIEAGEVFLRGRDVLKVSEEEMRHVRGAQIAMIFQDPMTSFNPVLTIGFQIAEALKLHRGWTTMRRESGRQNCWRWWASRRRACGWTITRTNSLEG